jgi:myosin heavy subunit
MRPGVARQPSLDDKEDALPWDAAEDTALSEGSLMKLIAGRYTAGAPTIESADTLWGMYTYAGDVVVAVNPYASKEEMTPLYDEAVMERCRDHAREGNRSKPHIYAVAAKAHQGVLADGKPQAVVINGESGAGKTETTKLMINYLIHVAGRTAADDSAAGHVRTMLMQSSPVLEAFGNAKTLRNDNSSRFGKYVRLLLSRETGRLVGATVEKCAAAGRSHSNMRCSPPPPVRSAPPRSASDACGRDTTATCTWM